MGLDKLSAEVTREIYKVPKAKRLKFLQDKISNLPEAERANAEHILSLALLSVDHSPDESRTAFQKLRMFFGWTDIVSLPMIGIGIWLILSREQKGEVEFSLTDMSVKTGNLGYVLLLLGVFIFLSRRLLNRAKP